MYGSEPLGAAVYGSLDAITRLDISPPFKAAWATLVRKAVFVKSHMGKER